MNGNVGARTVAAFEGRGRASAHSRQGKHITELSSCEQEQLIAPCLGANGPRGTEQSPSPRNLSNILKPVEINKYRSKEPVEIKK